MGGIWPGVAVRSGVGVSVPESIGRLVDVVASLKSANILTAPISKRVNIISPDLLLKVMLNADFLIFILSPLPYGVGVEVGNGSIVGVPGVGVVVC